MKEKSLVYVEFLKPVYALVVAENEELAANAYLEQTEVNENARGKKVTREYCVEEIEKVLRFKENREIGFHDMMNDLEQAEYEMHCSPCQSEGYVFVIGT